MSDAPPPVVPEPATRRNWPVHIYRLGQEPGDDLSSTSTAEERLEMLVVLSRRMWLLGGQQLPSYARSRMPVRIVRSR